MKRDDRRAELMAKIPAGYSGIRHMVVVLVGGLLVIAACAATLERPEPWHLGLLLGSIAFANFFEWWVHRGPLHHRWPGQGLLYDRHTRAHHVAFLEGDMAIRDARELRLVLFPPFVLPLLLAINAPLVALLWWQAGPDAARVFVIASVTYYLIYEALHTLHHAPAGVGRGRLASWLRRHHERHHDPTRMLHGNFNVSFPLTDILLRTTLRDAPADRGWPRGPVDGAEGAPVTSVSTNTTP